MEVLGYPTPVAATAARRAPRLLDGLLRVEPLGPVALSGGELGAEGSVVTAVALGAFAGVLRALG